MNVKFVEAILKRLSPPQKWTLVSGWNWSGVAVREWLQGAHNGH